MTPGSLAYAIEGSLTSPHSRTGLREQSVSGDHALVAALLVFDDSTWGHTNRLCSRLSRNDCRRTATRGESSAWPHATLAGCPAPTTASQYTLQTCSGSSSAQGRGSRHARSFLAAAIPLQSTDTPVTSGKIHSQC